MGVIDEGAGTGESEMRRERIARFIAGRDLLALAAPSRDPVGVTQQLDPVPVNGRRFAQPIDDDDVGRLSSV